MGHTNAYFICSAETKTKKKQDTGKHHSVFDDKNPASGARVVRMSSLH